MSTTATTIPTATEPALLQLMWLASPALPVGGFSYSEGLESAVEHGWVHDEASAGDWLCDQLALTLARADLPVLAQALVAARAGNAQRLAALDAWVRATRETAELRLQTEQMGHSLVAWLQAVRPEAAARARALGLAAPTYPLAFALAACAIEAPAGDVLAAYAFGWAENGVQAAVRAVPLGQSAGQRILGRLAAQVPVAVQAALATRDEDRQAFAPMLAIVSARHEIQYSRLFRS